MISINNFDAAYVCLCMALPLPPTPPATTPTLNPTIFRCHPHCRAALLCSLFYSFLLRLIDRHDINLMMIKVYVSLTGMKLLLLNVY